MQKLSIIIPYLNEDDYIVKTIESINQTSDKNMVDIIAIDDFSKKHTDLSKFSNVKSIRNPKRIGVDACRQMGVELSNHPYCLILDAHMFFKNDDWANKIIQYINNNPKTLFCTVCLGLGYGTLDVNKHMGKYFAADFQWTTDAEKDRPCRNIIEPRWAAPKDFMEYNVSCILGANYFFSKEWFMYIRGLCGLMSWGTSEPFLSIKSYLAGGDCKITKNIEIGHVFRDNAPYSTSVSDLIYNKIFFCKTLLPDDLSNKLIGFLVKDNNYHEAAKRIEKNMDIILENKRYYQSIFKYSIYDYCSQFNICLP